MRDLLALELPELEDRILAWGHPRFRARQLFLWLHGKGVFRVEEMQNLPQSFIEKIADNLPPFPVSLKKTIQADDGTRKFQFRLQQGGLIESVLIPEEKRLTLCLSTQLGCAMNCLFCRTGDMGLKRNLGTEEILGQYYAVRAMLNKKQAVTHVVFMGMGEPLANLEHTTRALKILTHSAGSGLSPRRITVSTVGLPKNLEVLFHEIPVAITLSLNAADNETRNRLMPINQRHPIETVLNTLKRLPLPPRRRFAIAYVLIQGENDTLKDARQLVRILHGLRCKINLIPFNPYPGSAFKRPADEVVLAFQDFLRSKGFSTHVRFSRGRDVMAACGQLGGDSSLDPEFSQKKDDPV